MKLDKGYIQVYTGNGRGKTTAAFGLALRAWGAGLKVYIGQFIKGGEYSEIKAFKHFKPRIKVEQYGSGCFIIKNPSKKDIESAEKGFKTVKKIISESRYDVVILDELNIILHLNMIPVDDVIDVLRKRPKNMEVIITGRYAPKDLLEAADLITEMKEKKHYYSDGVLARCGIEN